MTTYLRHCITRNPHPEDAGTITINATVRGYNTEFTASSFIEEFMDEDNYDECPSKEDLNYFLMESGINNADIARAMMELDLYVDEVTFTLSSSNSSTSPPEYALQVDLYIEDASFEETNNNIKFKPANKLVVKSLTRKIYDKISHTGEKCTICLEEFNTGTRLVTLPCGHEFDDECAVAWFSTSHFCPLCRFELPCDDQ